ncbi:uncharacterized protein METZ01_LOCUS292827 [marine metagenome]|uniref:Uncharacterized protein n=1 Tax=marine metagenome TaxID=408172 RepID=A0A382LU23_9ZZZZ
MPHLTSARAPCAQKNRDYTLAVYTEQGES